MHNKYFAWVLLFITIGETEIFAQQDSVIRSASLQYSNPSFLKRIVLGQNYRHIWATPVKLPVFRLSQSGFRIKDLGGGQQTKSLNLLDTNDREWALRTVNKDVTMAIPKLLRKTVAQKLVQDLTSAAHPYAPLVVGELAKGAGIVAAQPVLYLVADDKELGRYRKYFVNQFCYLEKKEPTPDKSDTKSTENMLEDIFKDNDHLILQRKILQTRLLDMLIADWDRHDGQWRWAVQDSAGKKFHYVIPRDRDQAFFNSTGLSTVIARWIAMKQLVGFKESTAHLKNLNYKAWDFDRTFLNELNEQEWKNITDSFLKKMTDSLIHTATKKMPPKIYSVSGNIIESKLKSRRDGMLKDVMNYYRFLSKRVVINGSSEDETFWVYMKNQDMVVFVTDRHGTKNIYERMFDKHETKKIVIKGMGGNDRFFVEKNINPSIKLVLEGDVNDDVHIIDGKIRKEIIDLPG